MTDVTLIIPAYNESTGVRLTAARLRTLLAEMRQTRSVEVIIVDDGSTDNTLELLHDAFDEDDAVRIVPHGTNRGLGAALRTGFERAAGEIIVTTDFDGTYDFSTIPEIITLLEQADVDIATASPYHPNGGVEGVPGYRLLFSYGASLLYRLLVRWNVYTWTALFRAYRRRVIDAVSFDSDDFLAGTELLVYALKAGFSVAQYPTVLHQRTFGQSSIKIARVTMAHLRFQARLLMGRVPGAPQAR